MIAGRFTIALGLCALGSSGVVHALEIEKIDSKFADKHYQLVLVTVIDAPLEKVQTILRDYTNYPKLDPRILEASVLGRPAPQELLLYTKLRACFGVICRNVKRVERVVEREHELQAVVLPEQSDATSGETLTVLTALGSRTRVSYSTKIAPGFWVPTVIGRPLMLRTLREASVDLFNHVEKQAQVRVDHARTQ